MPYKNPEDKKRWDMIHNPSRVHSNQAGKRIRLEENRNYVCVICALPWQTNFHEYNHDPTKVLELCADCHQNIKDEDYILEQININTLKDSIDMPETVGMI